MSLDKFLEKFKKDIDQFEVYMKVKYPDLGSDGSFTENDWLDQFLAWSDPEGSDAF